MANAPLFANRSQSRKIGCYIRVSTEEQAQNPEGSIRNQEERLKEIVKLKNSIEGNFGEITGIYVDRARSGKDTNRPELQKLLSAIRDRKVDLVLVSELSRLSRSMKDFADMWEMMRSYGCGILSLRENFDTTTAAGEMVLYTIANIAQFERRQTAERISANFAARASRGLYNGGPVPVGYTLDPDKKGHLMLNPDEAPLVRRVFEVFLERKTLAETAKTLNDQGEKFSKYKFGGKPRLGLFTIENVHHILRNRSYLGIRVYRNQGKKLECKAVWPAIVDQGLFDLVQELLGKNHGRYKPHREKRYPYLLSGLIYCGTCGDVMAGKSAHGNGGKIPFYDHGWAMRKQSGLVKKVFQCQSLMRVGGRKIEPLVWQKVRELLSSPEICADLVSEAQKIYETKSDQPEEERLRLKVQAFKLQLEALAERLAMLPKSVSPTPVFKQMEKIEEVCAETEGRLRELERKSGGGPDAEGPVSEEVYREFAKNVAALLPESPDEDPEFCRDLVSRLVQRVEVLPDGVAVHYYAGKENLGRRLAQPISGDGAYSKKKELDMISRVDLEGESLENAVLDPQKRQKVPESGKNEFFSGSSTLIFGGADRDRTDDLRIANATLYQLSYSPTQTKKSHANVPDS